MNTVSKIFQNAKNAQVIKNEALRKYMLGVYNYMSFGIFLTAFIAYVVYVTGFVSILIKSPLGLLFSLLPLGISVYLGSRFNSMSLISAKMSFIAYSASLGFSLSYIFIAYNPMLIVKSFLITSSIFAFMSIYGYTTKKDLSSLGSTLVMLLFGVIIASLVNIFTRSSAMSMIISLVSVFIFTGLVAFDTQKIKKLYYELEYTNSNYENTAKTAVIGALMLYVDFISIFIHLLHILSSREEK